MITHDLPDYSFVFHNWQLPANILSSGWYRMIHLGLPYITFWLSGTDLLVTCRIDPCSCPSGINPYTIMVRRDLLGEYRRLVLPT